ncbi:MAG: hypothetical protein CL406_01505 [Acidimicrobiaceae bacterium]|nr:hypothetical protein [Acidimicrobiaceae bacterium]
MLVDGWETEERLVKWTLVGFLMAALLVLLVAASGSGIFGSGGPLKRKLAGTEWVVVSMAGFPDDNVVDGAFDFTFDRFRYNDGVNFSSSGIKWDSTGFLIDGGGTSTAALAVPGPISHFNSFARIGSHVDVDIGEDGRLILTRDDLVVVAEPTG